MHILLRNVLEQIISVNRLRVAATVASAAALLLLLLQTDQTRSADYCG